MPEKLNIIHLHGHDAGHFFQPYGHNTPTPRLQQLAEQGVMFRRAFCAAPTCSPSRAALMTSQYPHVCGMHGLANPEWGYRINDYSHHLASFLNRNGYTTAVAGVQHEARAELCDLREVGYDRWLNHNESGTPISHTTTLGPALSYLAEPHDKPFFLSCGFGEPHRDNGKGGRRHGYDHDMGFVETADGRYTRPPAPIPDTPLTRNDWQTFREGVGRLDSKMGTIIDAVDRAGLAESTLIIATTDHGIAWPNGKGNLTDMGTNVMLIMRGPTGSGFEGGRVIDALVSHMDIFPMLCDLLGLDQPAWLQGVSMMPLINGSAESIRDHVFAEQGYHCQQKDPQRSIRTERYKYIRRMQGIDYIRVVDPGPTNDWFRKLGYRKHPEGTELLYDLYFDPQEVHNLADDPSHADVLNDLRQRLDAWLDETNDPFRTDDIPVPVALRATR